VTDATSATGTSPVLRSLAVTSSAVNTEAQKGMELHGCVVLHCGTSAVEHISPRDLLSMCDSKARLLHMEANEEIVKRSVNFTLSSPCQALNDSRPPALVLDDPAMPMSACRELLHDVLHMAVATGWCDSWHAGTACGHR
jgi:hypothetical protein